MNEKYMFNEASEISSLAHFDQKDKLGEPYIDHPIRVAKQLDGYLLKTIAILHDVNEDYGLDEFDMDDFPEIVFDVLDLLYHNKQTSYKDYIKEIKTSSLATKVKIADLMDNTDFERLDKIYEDDPETALRLAKKYVWALEYLSDKELQ